MSRILIFERSPSLLRDLTQALERSGYTPVAFDQADPFEHRLEDHGCRLALIDIQGEEELVWLDALQRSPAAAGVFAMGAQGSVEFAVECMKRGARDYLRKPFRIERLEERLRDAMQARPPAHHPVFVGPSEAVAALRREVQGAARGETTVVIEGERGTGRRAVAQWMHAASRRAAGPLVRFDCASAMGNRVETEVFGREAGAWLEAPDAARGVGARADGGTLLLEEIDRADPATQAALARLLEASMVRPVGARVERGVDVRVIATATRDLRDLVARGEFREDLFYRLDVVRLQVPPLRSRADDLPALADYLLRKHARAEGLETPRLSAADFARLSRHEFPGNLREFDQLMLRAAVLFAGSSVDLDALLGRDVALPEPEAEAAPSLNLRELERRAVEQSLAQANGNRTHASALLGINVRTLRNKIRAYGLR